MGRSGLVWFACGSIVSSRRPYHRRSCGFAGEVVRPSRLAVAVVGRRAHRDKNTPWGAHGSLCLRRAACLTCPPATPPAAAAIYGAPNQTAASPSPPRTASPSRSASTATYSSRTAGSSPPSSPTAGPSSSGRCRTSSRSPTATTSRSTPRRCASCTARICAGGSCGRMSTRSLAF